MKYTVTIIDTGWIVQNSARKAFTAEFEAENEAEARKQAKEFYAKELETTEEAIMVINVE